MNRRETIQKIFNTSHSEPALSPAAPPTTKLDPYTGIWGKQQAIHLLKRTTFYNHQMLETALETGMSNTVDLLLSEYKMPSPPVYYDYDNDPNARIGQSWVKVAQTEQEQRQPRRRSLFAWFIKIMFEQGMTIREKMVLFWHNHFVTGNINNPIIVYDYSTLLRENALGNFKELTKEITVNPAMLIYLNGNQNTKQAPNENYARELLELFTIGKGPIAGPGDYTNYTEDDVVAMAKVLTGWVVGNNRQLDIEYNGRYVGARHDITDKKLSHRFDEVVIPHMGTKEYKHLIDLIFQKEEVSRFLVRNLYRWFVYQEINEFVEQEIIEPLAQLLRESDYEVKPVMEVLLKSEHFYDQEFIGAIIKNPVDFVIGPLVQFGARPADQKIRTTYNWYRGISRLLTPLQMQLYNPPDVAGWKAYYQEPNFYQQWINSGTLQGRMAYTNFITVGTGRPNRDIFLLDVLNFVSKIENSLNPVELIKELAVLLLPHPITDAQIDALKEVLIPGLPDYEWTIEYGDYLSNPNNEGLKKGVENKLRNLLKAMMAMPEFYLG